MALLAPADPDADPAAAGALLFRYVAAHAEVVRVLLGSRAVLQRLIAVVTARIVAERIGMVRDGSGSVLETVRIDCGDATSGLTLWAHVDVDRDDAVSAGDYLTTVSYPVSDAGGRHVLVVGRVT